MNEEQFTLNIEGIAADATYMSVTRLLASTLLQQPYLTVGEWLAKVSDNDLKLLIEAAEEASGDDVEVEPNSPFENVMLISMMLMLAEGLDLEEAEVYENANVFVVMLTMEGMSRKKLVDIDYEHLSFGSEFKDVVVVKKRPELDDYIEGLEDD